MNTMHTPSCDNHDTREAYGLTENSEFLCRPCLTEVRRYAAQHVPEALEGITESAWIAHCHGMMLQQMREADEDAAVETRFHAHYPDCGCGGKVPCAS